MHIILHIILVVWIFSVPNCIAKKRAAKDQSCKLKWTQQLPSWFPLIWNTTSIMYPQKVEEGQWEIRLPSNSALNIGCSKDDNMLSKFNQPSGRLTCDKGKVKIGKELVNFGDLGCDDKLTEHVVTTGKCLTDTKFNKIQIQFQSSNTAFPLITVCHNPQMDETVLSHHIIYGSSLNTFEVSNKRPGFKEAEFYKDINANKAYSQNSQKETLGELLGSDSIASKYIDTSKSFYFARGHLAPDGDFVHIYEQNASYYFINVVPQWQSINNGNWKALEIAVRKYAVDKATHLQVWTGAIGVLKLADVSGNLVEIYLAKDNSGKLRLPAPEIMWKLVHDPTSKAAVVIFVINNPHLQDVGQELILCQDICSTISWVKWKIKSIPKGFTYCCDIKSSKHVIKNVPNLGKVKLMS